MIKHLIIGTIIILKCYIIFKKNKKVMKKYKKVMKKAMKKKIKLKRFIKKKSIYKRFDKKINLNFYVCGNEINDATFIDNPSKYYKDKGILEGQICSPIQIKTFYPNAVIHKQKDNYFVELNGETIPLKEFNKRHFKLDDLMKLTVIHNQYTTKDKSLLVILTIGNIKIGKKILSAFKQEHKKYHLIVNLNKDIAVDEIKSYCEANFESFDLLTTLNYGNDIIPYLIAFNYSKKYTYKYLFKLHTKSNRKWRSNMINYFFEENNMDEAVQLFKDNPDIGQICTSNLMKNNGYNAKALDLVIKQWGGMKFVGGTVFIVRRDIQEYFMETYADMVHAAAVMPFYFDNNDYYNTSPVHTLERLLGFVVYEKNMYIYNFKNQLK